MRRASLLLCLVLGCGAADTQPPPSASPDAGRTDVGDAQTGTETATSASIHRTDNHQRDTDCDGLTDREEFSTRWASGARTDPNRADTDGDGLPDGLEAGRISSVADCPDLKVDADPDTTTDPTRADTDADGLDDGVEDTNRDGAYARLTETDPRNPDTDGDGLCDGPLDVPGLCTGGDPTPAIVGVDSDGDGITDSKDPNPQAVDTDGDGLCDGPLDFPGQCTAGEDRNADGAHGPTETHPERIDTDCDGLVDGKGFAGHVGEADVGTDPTHADSDGDGLTDGLELGIVAAPDANCPGFQADLDPSQRTNPLAADSDGDGVPDGAEDQNQNGRVDAEEFDPNEPSDVRTDATVPAACGTDRIRPIQDRAARAPDLRRITVLDAAGGFQAEAPLTDADGTELGWTAYHPAHRTAFLTLSLPPPGANVSADATWALARWGEVGRIEAAVSRRIDSWDGYPAIALRFRLRHQGALDETLDRLRRAVAPSSQGAWTHAAVPSANAYEARGVVLRRTDRRMIVNLAIAPAEGQDEAAGFTLEDAGDASGIGQALDGLTPHCERFETQGYAKLDILWAVDNSGSMQSAQRAVAESAAATRARLDASTIDWRAALVTSAFFAPDTAECINTSCGETVAHQCRAFTTDLDRFSGWLTEGATGWVGAGGSCGQLPGETVQTENAARGAEMILSAPPAEHVVFMPPTPMPDPLRVRRDAHLLLVFLGDADDQFFSDAEAPEGIDHYERFFRGLGVSSLTMGGIICPEGELCNEAQRRPRVIRNLIDRFGGSIGSILDVASIGRTVATIIDNATDAVSPYRLTRDAIPATLRVALTPGSTIGPCPHEDVPRSRVHGFDYDPVTRSIGFFGRCRPDPDRPGQPMAVSYRSWRDQSPDPAGSPCDGCGGCPGRAQCNESSCRCECAEAASCAPGLTWDSTRCDCVCSAEALACESSREADLAACACVCQDDCGGCGPAARCDQNRCACVDFDP